MSVDTSAMRGSMNTMQTDIGTLRGDMSNMSQVMGTMRTMGPDVHRMTTSVDGMAADVDVMSHSVGIMSTMTLAVQKMSVDTRQHGPGYAPDDAVQLDAVPIAVPLPRRDARNLRIHRKRYRRQALNPSALPWAHPPAPYPAHASRPRTPSIRHAEARFGIRRPFARG